MAPATWGKGQAVGDTRASAGGPGQAAAAGQKSGDGQEPSATPVKAAAGVFADPDGAAASQIAPAVTEGAQAPDRAVSTEAANPAGQQAPDADRMEASGTGSSIHVARVLESVHGSEMRVGMRTEEFGTISVTTSVNREQIATQISFDHGDLGRMLATHLPGMQEKLGSETGLHATIEVLDRGGNGHQSGSSSGSASQQPGAGHSGAKQPSAASQASFTPELSPGVFVHPPGEGPEGAGTSRLDVRI